MKTNDLFPTVDQLNAELARSIKSKRLHVVLRSVLITLTLIVFFAFLAAYELFVIFQIQDSGMSPTLENGQIVIGLKNGQIKKGDIVAFYSNNQLLVKRIIACEGDIVAISDSGVVAINHLPLDEPYANPNTTSTSDLSFPYRVPAGRFFVLGDNRAISLDSRHNEIGCIAQEQIVGRLFLRIWPVQLFSSLIYKQ